MLIARHWDPCAVLSAFISLGFGGTVGAAQFAATFRGRTNFAYLVAVLLLGLGLSLIAAIAVGNAELVLKHGLDFRFFPFGMEIFVAGVLLTLLAIADGYCAWQTDRSGSKGQKSQCAVLNRQFTLSELLILVTVLATIVAITTAFVRSAHPEYAEHVRGDQVPARLPADASEVNYWDGSRGTFDCEFSCSEQAFRDWIASRVGSIESEAAMPKLVEITAPFSVPDSGRPGGPTIGNVTVVNGLIYKWNKEDRGVLAVFDRSTGRAYYSFHSH